MTTTDRILDILSSMAQSSHDQGDLITRTSSVLENILPNADPDTMLRVASLMDKMADHTLAIARAIDEIVNICEHHTTGTSGAP